MTYTELCASIPRIRGEVNGLVADDGKTYNVFVCHGCQSCWYMQDDDTVAESYPHFLSVVEQT